MRRRAAGRLGWEVLLPLLVWFGSCTCMRSGAWVLRRAWCGGWGVGDGARHGGRRGWAGGWVEGGGGFRGGKVPRPPDEDACEQVVRPHCADVPKDLDDPAAACAGWLPGCFGPTGSRYSRPVIQPSWRLMMPLLLGTLGTGWKGVGGRRARGASHVACRPLPPLPPPAPCMHDARKPPLLPRPPPQPALPSLAAAARRGSDVGGDAAAGVRYVLAALSFSEPVTPFDVSSALLLGGAAKLVQVGARRGEARQAGGGAWPGVNQSMKHRQPIAHVAGDGLDVVLRGNIMCVGGRDPVLARGRTRQCPVTSRQRFWAARQAGGAGGCTGSHLVAALQVISCKWPRPMHVPAMLRATAC